MGIGSAHRQFLLDSQNSDGGWGYFPGKQSWLEPTVYAALGLVDDPGGAAHRAWKLLKTWQNADGGWRPNAAVPESTWGTALAVTLGDALGESGPEIAGGVQWLINVRGEESSTLARVLRMFGAGGAERDIRLKGWPWRSGTSAWVEPTAHSLIALRRAARRRGKDRALRDRIDSGERMLLGVQCADGGWNYGSPRALGLDLPSYPETTGLALAGLQGRAPSDALHRVRGCLQGDVSPFARAWLGIALRLSGGEPLDRPNAVPESGDILQTALDCLAAGDGNWRLLQA